jgi:hypothetical protein
MTVKYHYRIDSNHLRRCLIKLLRVTELTVLIVPKGCDASSFQEQGDVIASHRDLRTINGILDSGLNEHRQHPSLKSPGC